VKLCGTLLGKKQETRIKKQESRNKSARSGLPCKGTLTPSRGQPSDRDIALTLSQTDLFKKIAVLNKNAYICSIKHVK